MTSPANRTPAKIPVNTSPAKSTSMNVVIVGHVDHGKSTVIGRLLTDTHCLPKGKLDQVKEMCRRNARPFEYAFLLDALKDEQAQGITIDAARCFFKTAKRHYIIIDAPGHIEFLKNMITGASRAEAALLVIDANEGIQENSKRHGYLLSMLGVKQITILVNKMDLKGYNEDVFLRICAQFSEFLNKIGVAPNSYIPVSGTCGDNIAHKSDKMNWYQGKTVLETLDDFISAEPVELRPFRMPVQSVYKFTSDGDDRRIIAGTVDSGSACAGDEVVFYPSGKKSRIKTIEAFHCAERTEMTAGFASGFTLTEQIYVRRGEMATLCSELPPHISSRMEVSLFWLGKRPLEIGKEYVMKLGTSRTPVRLLRILSIMDASNLAIVHRDKILQNDVADCILQLERPIAFDLSVDITETGRFVLIDQYEIAGGGVVREALEDGQTVIQKEIAGSDIWCESVISSEERGARCGQKPALILFVGQRGAGKNALVKNLEKRLFDEGHFAYFIGIGNFQSGRAAESLHLMLEAGAIVLATADVLTREDQKAIRTAAEPGLMKIYHVGKQTDADINSDRELCGLPGETALEETINALREDGIIFNK